MATTVSTIRDRARATLKETSASFWTDAELLAHIVEGTKDLWGAIIDLHQEHFNTIDATNVTLAANSGSLTGVPSNVFRVLLIEPRDTTSTGGTSRNIVFVPRDYNSDEFTAARSLDAQDPLQSIVIYYSVSSAGFPVAAPTILVAPQLSSAINLKVSYIPGLPTLAASDPNPIPGESDNALYAWCIAYARAKEREDRSPDPNWLAIYATEKQNMLTRMTPRQEQEPEIVPGLFESEW